MTAKTAAAAPSAAIPKLALSIPADAGLLEVVETAAAVEVAGAFEVVDPAALEGHSTA